MFKTFIITLTLIIMGFSLYAYNVRTDYNCDRFREENIELKYQNEALLYALSIVPKDVKSEVFTNSITEKFPKIVDHHNVCSTLLIGTNEKETDKKETDEKKTDEKKEDKTTMSPTRSMNNFLSTE